MHNIHVHAHTKCRGFESHLNSLFFFGKKAVSGVVVLCCIAFLSCLNRCLSSTHVVYRCTCTCTCTQCVQLEYTMNGNHIKCHDGNCLRLEIPRNGVFKVHVHVYTMYMYTCTCMYSMCVLCVCVWCVYSMCVCAC